MTTTRVIRARPALKEKSELSLVLKQMRKQYGPHIAALANEMGQPERIPTGIFILDFALLGGIAHNRITHIVGERSAGKSMLASKIAAGAQQQFPDNQVVLVDVEGTQETTWTSKLGVDPERLLVVQPETGEHAVDIVDALASSKEVSLLVVDSIAALVPMREIDVSAEDALVGEQARLVGRMIRKVTAILIKERMRGHAITILLVNQFRSRIGGYGDPRCVHADTMVCFADGTSFPIRQVVEYKMKGQVWSYNEITERFEAKQVIGWHYNGEVGESEYLSIRTQGVESLNGVFGLTVTKDHKLLTTDGWKNAEQLRIGDYLISKYPTQLSGSVRDFVYGMMCGDIGIVVSGTVARVQLEDKNNNEYLAWKLRKLSPFYRFVHKRYIEKGQYRDQYSMYGSTEFAVLYNTFGGIRDPMVMLRNFSPLSMAIWVMDDGYLDDHMRIVIAVGRLSGEYLQELSDCLQEEYGLENKVKQDKQIVFSATGSDRLGHIVRPYVPPCMQHKLPKWCRGFYQEFLLQNNGTEFVQHPAKVIDIGVASKRKMKQRGKYDISVADNFNYVVGGASNGVVIHNSLPGGRAIEFCATLQLIIKNKETQGRDEYDVEAVTENEHSFLIQKNKLNGGVRTGEFRLLRLPSNELGLGEGDVDDAGTMLAYAKKFGVYTGAGSSWTLTLGEDAYKFRGVTEASIALYQDRDLYWRLRNRLIGCQAEHLGMSADFVGRYI